MANNILEMALEQLDFPPSTISAWFDDVTVVSFGDNRLVLHSPVPFKKEFIDSKFIAPLQEVLHNLTGRCGDRRIHRAEHEHFSV